MAVLASSGRGSKAIPRPKWSATILKAANRAKGLLLAVQDTNANDAQVHLGEISAPVG
jgi:hypothetical protein